MNNQFEILKRLKESIISKILENLADVDTFLVKKNIDIILRIFRSDSFLENNEKSSLVLILDLKNEKGDFFEYTEDMTIDKFVDFVKFAIGREWQKR